VVFTGLLYYVNVQNQLNIVAAIMNYIPGLYLLKQLWYVIPQQNRTSL